MATTRAKFKKPENTIKTMVISNDDLLIEILRRLPAKSIIRFKSVSKHWQTLLSQRYFTLLFDNLSRSPGFFCHYTYIPFDVDNQSTKPLDTLGFYPDLLGIRIVQSCNGLLLCCSNELPEHTCGTYYVLNPTTKQFAIIPPVRGNYYIPVRFIGLAFHHNDCVNYKVVCAYPANAYLNSDKKLYQIQIYSSDTGKWRVLRESFPMSLSVINCLYGVYWNGAIYWALRHDLFYFKLDPECLQQLPLPEYDGKKVTSVRVRNPFHITDSRGHLHLTETASSNGRLHLNVYEMMNDHSQWFLKYRVENLELLALSLCALNYRFYDIEILDVVRGEKEADSFMLVRIPNKIMKYNILDRSFKLILDHSGILSNSGIKAYRYIESIGSF